MICREHSVSAVCDALGLSRSGHYARALRPPSRRSGEDLELGDLIEKIYRENRGVYGYPRMRMALARMGMGHSRRRVARLMSQRGLAGRSRGRFKPQGTDSSHGFGYDPNLLGGEPFPRRAHQVWVSDTTYIRTAEGWAYLAATMDLCSRCVVGWSVSSANDSELTVSALEKARRKHHGVKPMHHSDRGSTYASERFRESLGKLEAVRSMSRKGNCYDNAAMESFFGTLKAECVQGFEYRDIEQANSSLFAYIEGFYNTRRLHTSIGMAPMEKLREAAIPSPSCSQGGCGDSFPSESSPPHEQLGLDTSKRVTNNQTQPKQRASAV